MYRPGFEQNPGLPKNNTTHATTFTCSICNQLITPKQYSLFCNTHLSLKHWVHKKCTTTTLNDYHPAWTCPLHTQLTTTPPPPNTITTPPIPILTHQPKPQIQPSPTTLHHPKPNSKGNQNQNSPTQHQWNQKQNP